MRPPGRIDQHCLSDETRLEKGTPVFPPYSADELIGLLKEEIIQKEQEGAKVRGWAGKVRAAGKDVGKLERVYDQLVRVVPPRDVEDREPSDLKSIRKLRPKGPRRIKMSVSKSSMRNRLRGAMLGRCAGCLLGKPVEGWGRERIETALRKDRRWPLDFYFRESTIRKDKPINPKAGPGWCTLGHFDCMERDDDIDYTILGVHYLRTYGRKFTTAHVADEWRERLPYHMTYTAERAAYKNLVIGVPLEQVAMYRNPFREWIGAQIRADGFGYCAAGLPQLAAEFAHRDASLSHVKNGIYGEMLFASMIAAAAVCDDLDEVIDIGLSEIPAECRLAAAVRDVRRWCGENKNWIDTLDAMYDAFGRYNWVHTINNAAAVIMAVCYGRQNLGKTVSLAVMAGWDTDCNGATAGSIVGAMLGADDLPKKWIRPLNNRLRSFVAGYDNWAITDVADLAAEINRTLR